MACTGTCVCTREHALCGVYACCMRHTCNCGSALPGQRPLDRPAPLHHHACARRTALAAVALDFLPSAPPLCAPYLDNIHALDNLPKDDMLAVEPRRHDGRNEELRPVCVWACICHRQQPGL
ncbi:hypothetical protein PMAC_000693 [Pneumocystis sp. 'macacae']|nr:hypothetical protein PMAC_000693 [Pneumocystis sp. 'macacae']